MNRRRSILCTLALVGLTAPIGSFGEDRNKVWRVGFLSPVSASNMFQSTDAFVHGMRDLGYVDGKNLVIEWRFADGQFERLPSMAADLVQAKVDVIVAVASPAIAAAQKATSRIPIVMATTGDPVASHFVKSLAHPGGNITGFSSIGGDITPKLLDLLRSVLPKLSRVGVLVTPTSTTHSEIAQSARGASENLGLQTIVVEAASPQELENAFSTLKAQKAEAIIVGTSSLFAQQRKQIADLAIQHKLPTIFGNRVNVAAGGLMSYGYKVTDNYRRSADYVDKIFKGAQPAEMPVQQPVLLELTVNLTTAKAIGLAIPESLLLRADEVIQ